MVSKYQISLNIYNYLIKRQGNLRLVPSASRNLQELVDRANPKKPIKIDRLFENYFRNKIGICECGSSLYDDDNFCSNCGQEIDLSENE